MCGFCNVWCVCLGFVMCGCVYVWVCVCVGFVMCGYVRMCGCGYVWVLQYVGVLVMCACIYCVLYCLYCVFVLFRLCISFPVCFVCTSVRTSATE